MFYFVLEIFGYVESKLQEGTGGCIYISGNYVDIKLYFLINQSIVLEDLEQINQYSIKVYQLIALLIDCFFENNCIINRLFFIDVLHYHWIFYLTDKRCVFFRFINCIHFLF